MKSLLRKCMSLLNENARFKIYRRFAIVPTKALDPEITLEVASSITDLQQAYALLHDCYVGINIIQPQPSGLRCNLFSFLPNTTTIVAKKNGSVIGTVSLIRDSSFGLPSDKEFQQQNSPFRKDGKKLVEVSALAVRADYRSADHAVSLLLMKYLYNFTKNFFYADQLVAIVHPKAQDFYQALWQFKRNGPVIRYNSLNKALGVHLTMDLSAAHIEKVVADFQSGDVRKNLGLFCQQPDSRLRYPLSTAGKAIHPVITPEIVNYFCATFHDIWELMSNDDRNSLVKVYSTYFGTGAITIAHGLLPQEIFAKEYRTPLQLQSLLKFENQASFATISDLSAGGCFIETINNLLGINAKIVVSFKLGAINYRVPAEIAWRSENSIHSKSVGVEVRFLKPIHGLNSELRDWLYADVMRIILKQKTVLKQSC